MHCTVPVTWAISWPISVQSQVSGRKAMAVESGVIHQVQRCRSSYPPSSLFVVQRVASGALTNTHFTAQIPKTIEKIPFINANAYSQPICCLQSMPMCSRHRALVARTCQSNLAHSVWRPIRLRGRNKTGRPTRDKRVPTNFLPATEALFHSAHRNIQHDAKGRLRGVRN